MDAGRLGMGARSDLFPVSFFRYGPLRAAILQPPFFLRYTRLLQAVFSNKPEEATQDVHSDHIPYNFPSRHLSGSSCS